MRDVMASFGKHNLWDAVPMSKSEFPKNMHHASRVSLQPRLIRMRDAPDYVGIDRNKFNAEIRPYLTEIPLGSQAIAFDRLEIDAWIEDYIERNGRPSHTCNGGKIWGKENHRASSKETISGTSTNASAGGEFARARALISSAKQNNI